MPVATTYIGREMEREGQMRGRGGQDTREGGRQRKREGGRETEKERGRESECKMSGVGCRV